MFDIKKAKVGDKVRFSSWRSLKQNALCWSALGYGVCVVGFQGIQENILTITALPEEKEKEDTQ